MEKTRSKRRQTNSKPSGPLECNGYFGAASIGNSSRVSLWVWWARIKTRPVIGKGGRIRTEPLHLIYPGKTCGHGQSRQKRSQEKGVNREIYRRRVFFGGKKRSRGGSQPMAMASSSKGRSKGDEDINTNDTSTSIQILISGSITRARTRQLNH